MHDEAIIALYWARDEEAIAASEKKYGAYCRAIGRGILKDEEDVSECLSDTWLRAWNAMPPQRPAILRAFLGKITRNLALNRWEKQNAQKRADHLTLALEELEPYIPAVHAEPVETLALTRALERFLDSLPEKSRRIFLLRYWYILPVQKIARDLGMSGSAVKMQLLRAREQLRAFLEEEGIEV